VGLRSIHLETEVDSEIATAGVAGVVENVNVTVLVVPQTVLDYAGICNEGNCYCDWLNCDLLLHLLEHIA